MYTQEFATDLRIVNVTSAAGAASLKALVATALAAKSGAATVLPPGSVIQVALTPSANITVSDMITQDAWTHPLNVRHFYPVKNALDILRIAGVATVTVEIYTGE